MIECIDLFCGAGGLSLGLQRAGIKIRTAVDIDVKCGETYRGRFPNVSFLQKSIQEVRGSELLKKIRNPDRVILAGGPPCQLFSRLNKKPADMTDEVLAYTKLIREVNPAFVVFENVPAIARRSGAWNCVLDTLDLAGYSVDFSVVNSANFGLAQNRKRMILVAGRIPVEIPKPKLPKIVTVRDAIEHLPDLSEDIPNHRSLILSDGNRKRIQGLKQGQYSRTRGTSFADSYARMEWDKPSPTITTKCISFSNGRFGHPEYNRGLTVREAAILQGFPDDFIFTGTLWDCARQVGNAVPPPIAEAIGKAIIRECRKQDRLKKRR